MQKMTLGERMKSYEQRETERAFLPLIPVYARIDGRSFHSFTRGMKRPYDDDMSYAMIETTKYLVEHTHAKIGYTQSDEISLVFYARSYYSNIFFDGSIFKMTSNLASLATAKFMQMGIELFPGRVHKMLPTFDCRLTQLPSKKECVNMLIWRVRDAVKNSVSMAASTIASDNKLKGANTIQRLDFLHDAGINWNDYPRFFKEGVFVKRIQTTRMLSDDELQRIPAKYRPTGPVIRSAVVALDLPPFERIANKEEFVFYDAAPIIMEGIDSKQVVNL